MDRGFGGYNRGSNQNFRRDDRRYDDFYSDRDRRSGNFGANRGNRGSSRDQGFFGQQGNQNHGQNSVIAALQLQNQNLLNAYIRNQQSTPRNSGFQQRKGYQGSGGFRTGDKRKQDHSTGPSGFKKSKPSSSRSPKRSSSNTPRRKDPPKEELTEEELPDIPDNEVEIPDSLMDNVEKLRQRKEVERNVADEDVDKLLVFCFNGKGYQCLTCGLLLTKDTAFRNHLMAKGHVMNVIDARSAKKYQDTRDILDIDLQPDGWYEKSDRARNIILKQAKLIMKISMEKKKRDLENYNKEPKNFFAVNMSSRKSATLKNDTVRITSVVESTIDVKEFSKDRFFGCEFVKSVASFHCRLCDTKIQHAADVIPHIDSRVHRNKYQLHLKRNPNYEKTQKEQNKELGDILQEHEGSPVLLSESNSDEGEDRETTLIDELDSFLVRVPEILNPPEKEEAKPEEKKDSEKGEEKKDTPDETADKDTKDESETGEATEEKGDEEKMETGDTKNGAEEETVRDEVVQQEKEVDDAVENPPEDKEAGEIAGEVTEQPDEKTEKPVENSTTEQKETLDSKPKSILKKPTSNAKPRGGGAKRGTPKRARGGAKPTPPRATRRKQIEEVNEEPTTPTGTTTKETTTKETTKEEESIDDGSFMDGFQVVDEVQEE